MCKNSCDWRIHVSLVQCGPTFQIKTIKGEHTFARSHSNNLAKYKCFGMRIENIVRDNQDIMIDQLEGIISRNVQYIRVNGKF